MVEQVWERPHGPTAIVASEQLEDTTLRVGTDIAMMGIKLNAQVTIKNLQNAHEKPRQERKGGWS